MRGAEQPNTPPAQIRYELVGGPKDGEFRTMERKPEGWEYYVFRKNEDAPPDLLPTDPKALREATYVVRYGAKSERPQMIWQGDK